MDYFTSSIFVANSGHGNKDVINEISKHLKKPLYIVTIILLR